MEEDPTLNETYLLLLLNLGSLAQLNRLLSEPDVPETLNRMEPPDDFYEEIAKAEEQQEMIENLERLYVLSPPPSKGHT